MEGSRRARLGRYAAPAALLAAATVAVLLVRAGLKGSSSPVTTAPTFLTVATTQAIRTPDIPTIATTTTGTTTAREEPRRYYVVRGGDTLADIAARFDTTVHELLLLNPGVRATSLRIGQKLRVQ